MKAIPASIHRISKRFWPVAAVLMLTACGGVFPVVTKSILPPTKPDAEMVEAAIDVARDMAFPPATKIDKQNGLVEFGSFTTSHTGITAQVRRRTDGSVEVTVRNGAVYFAKSPDETAAKFTRELESRIKVGGK
jgi:hypothetical protein